MTAVLRAWLKAIVREAFREEIEAQQKETLRKIVLHMREGQRGVAN